MNKTQFNELIEKHGENTVYDACARVGIAGFMIDNNPKWIVERWIYEFKMENNEDVNI